MASKQNVQNTASQIFITGFPKTFIKPDFLDHFAQYGEVASIQLHKKTSKQAFGFVVFQHDEAVSKVLSCSHVIKGHPIITKMCHKSRPVYTEPDVALSSEELVGQLKDCRSVSEQIETFINVNAIDQEDMRIRHQVCANVVTAIREFYPDSMVHAYGSTSNGFGLKSSDIDLLFEPTFNYWDIDWSKESSKGLAVDINIHDIHKGLIERETLERQPPHVHVKFLHKVLRRNQHLFFRVIHITARCPIVRFVHKKSGIQCDISCSNRLVLLNTRLLRTFSFLDPRVSPLMIVLRYWSKHVGLTRGGVLSSYAFSLLVIFFLQNTSPPVLPSVMYLRSKADASVFEAGFECSFTENPEKVKPSENQHSVEKLMLSFFEYYAEFDFANVVSPLYGTPCEREVFIDQHGESFKSAPMCIQDPLESSRNITAFLAVTCFLKLKEEMRYAASQFRSSHLPSAADPFWGILSLLKEKKPIENPLTMVPYEHKLPTPKRSMVFTLVFRKDLKDCMSNFKENGCSSLVKVSTKLFNLFRHMLIFDAEIVDYSPLLPVTWGTHAQPVDLDLENLFGKGSSQTQIVGTSDVDKKSSSLPAHTDPELLISIQNVVSHNVWFKRNKSKPDPALSPQERSDNLFRAETNITRTLMTKATKLLKPMLFTCECYFYREDSHDRIAFLLVPSNQIDDISSLFHFIKSFIKYMMNNTFL